MSHKVTKYCDRCDKKIEEYGPPVSLIPDIAVWLDRMADAAGGMEDVHNTYDVCPKCMKGFLNELLSKNPDISGHPDLRELFQDWMKKKVKK